MSIRIVDALYIGLAAIFLLSQALKNELVVFTVSLAPFSAVIGALLYARLCPAIVRLARIQLREQLAVTLLDPHIFLRAAFARRLLAALLPAVLVYACHLIYGVCVYAVTEQAYHPAEVLGSVVSLASYSALASMCIIFPLFALLHLLESLCRIGSRLTDIIATQSALILATLLPLAITYAASHSLAGILLCLPFIGIAPAFGAALWVKWRRMCGAYLIFH